MLGGMFKGLDVEQYGSMPRTCGFALIHFRLAPYVLVRVDLELL